MISSLDGGGSEQQTVMLARHLNRQQFAPELLVLRRGGVLESSVPSDVPIHCLNELVKPAAFYWPGQVHRNQVKALTQLLLQRRIDVIYDRTFHMSLIAAPAASEVKVPRVSTVVSPPSFAVPLNAGRFLWIKRQKLAIAYRTAQRVIAVSQAVASDMRQYYGLRRRIDVVLNPVDIQRLQQQASLPISIEVNTRIPPDSRFRIVCVGRMSAEKGHGLLIAALAKVKAQTGLSTPRLILVGDGPLRSTLERQTSQLGLTDDVTFTGHVPVTAPLIKSADLLVLPSLFEGFPNVVLEALALKTPVLASDIPVIRQLGRIGQPQHRGRDCVATFQSGDESSLAMKILSVRLNSTARRSRVSAGFQLIENSLSVQAQLPRLEQILWQTAASSESIHANKS